MHVGHRRNGNRYAHPSKGFDSTSANDVRRMALRSPIPAPVPAIPTANRTVTAFPARGQVRTRHHGCRGRAMTRVSASGFGGSTRKLVFTRINRLSAYPAIWVLRPTGFHLFVASLVRYKFNESPSVVSSRSKASRFPDRFVLVPPWRSGLRNSRAHLRRPALDPGRLGTDRRRERPDHGNAVPVPVPALRARWPRHPSIPRVKGHRPGQSLSQIWVIA